MIIKEGSKLEIIDFNRVVIDNIIVQEDIEIENNGEGYTFLLRNDGSKENCIFESYKITENKDGYVVDGVFKDAILVVENKSRNIACESYLEYDN